jgi:hypothetical protein
MKNMALSSALSNDLTVPAAINVTDKCDSNMNPGSDWLWQGGKGGTGYNASQLRSTYPINLVYYVTWFQRSVLFELVLVIFAAGNMLHVCKHFGNSSNATQSSLRISTNFHSIGSVLHRMS